MLIESIGLFHLFHSPILITLPTLFTELWFYNAYLQYFFIVMFSYTFINGECPISYAAKRILDKNYIAGQCISYYPEMISILRSDEHINAYFGCTTTIYIITLLHVAFQSNVPILYLMPAFASTLLYFLFVREIYFKKDRYYPVVQQITRNVLFVTICYVSTVSSISK